MDSFGTITRKDWLLSPGARVVLKAVKTAAVGIYATAPAEEDELVTLPWECSRFDISIHIGYRLSFH